MMKDDIQKKTIVDNWKMHTTSSDAKQLAQAIVVGLENEGGVSIILSPPFPYLAMVGEILKDTHIMLGAQNMYPEKVEQDQLAGDAERGAHLGGRNAAADLVKELGIASRQGQRLIQLSKLR